MVLFLSPLVCPNWNCCITSTTCLTMGRPIDIYRLLDALGNTRIILLAGAGRVLDTVIGYQADDDMGYLIHCVDLACDSYNDFL